MRRWLKRCAAPWRWLKRHAAPVGLAGALLLPAAPAAGQYYRPGYESPPHSSAATGGDGAPEVMRRGWVDVYCVAWGLAGLCAGMILMRVLHRGKD